MLLLLFDPHSYVTRSKGEHFTYLFIPRLCTKNRQKDQMFEAHLRREQPSPSTIFRFVQKKLLSLLFDALIYFFIHTGYLYRLGYDIFLCQFACSKTQQSTKYVCSCCLLSSAVINPSFPALTSTISSAKSRNGTFKLRCWLAVPISFLKFVISRVFVIRD